MRRITIATLSLVLAGGCAASHHEAIGPRVSAGYVDRGHLVAVQLRDAAVSRGPSSGAVGLAARMGGSVCGTTIAYDAEYWGRFMSVSGFATNTHSEGDSVTISRIDEHHRTCSPHHASGYNGGQSDSRPVELEVRDIVADGKPARTMRGSIGEEAYFSETPAVASPPAHGVDLRLSRDELAGEVGLRRYEMRRQGDDFVGHFTMYGHKVPFVLRGADELWSMPAAAQAAILPLVLSCTEEKRVIQRVDLRDPILAAR